MNNPIFYCFLKKVLAPFKLHIIAQCFVAIIWAIDISLRPYLIKNIINSAAEFNTSKDFEVKHVYLSVILYITLSIIVFFVLRLREWVVLKSHPTLKQSIVAVLIKRLMNHSQSFYHNHFSGGLGNKINEIANGIQNILNTAIDKLLSHFLALCIAIYVLYLVDYKFAIGLVIWTAAFLTTAQLSYNKTQILVKAATEEKSKVISQIIDILGNICSVKLFAREAFEVSRLNGKSNNLVRAEEAKDKFFLKIHSFQGGSFVLFQIISFWWLLKDLESHTATVGDFALVMMINISVIACLHNLSKDIREFTESCGSVLHGFNIIYSKPELINKLDSKDIEIQKGTIVFKDVSFQYPNSDNIFNKLSMTIYQGQKIGLVGYSGSGKSTLINLILRMFDIQKGSILIDEHDIRDITQESLKKSISIIPQDLALFNRSLMENIRYGRIDATDQEVIEAAKQAYIDTFISSLPKKYNTMVGERGVKISGGERQRIAIARAILKNAPILILDEATSHLDYATESLIQKSINNLMKNKTTIVIAHRLSTLLSLDRILVLHNGNIVQDGTHEQLIQQNGIYKILWSSQQYGV